MCGDKSTTLYLCFYLWIRRLCIVGHVWRQVNHVLFAFLPFHGGHWHFINKFHDISKAIQGHPWRVAFLLLIRRLRNVGHVWRQVNHVLFVFLSFHQTATWCGTRAATSQPRFICVFIFSWWPLKFHKLISRKFPRQFKDIHDGWPPCF